MLTRRELEAQVKQLRELADNNYEQSRYHSENFEGLLKQHRKLEERFVKAQEVTRTLQKLLDEYCTIAEQAQFGWEAAERMRRIKNNELL